MAGSGIEVLIALLFGMGILIVIGMPLNALLLMLSTKIFKLKDCSYMTSFKAASLLLIAPFIITPLIGLIFADFILRGVVSLIVIALVGLWVVKIKYNLEWNNAIPVELTWFVFSLVVGFIIGQIIVRTVMVGLAGGF